MTISKKLLIAASLIFGFQLSTTTYSHSSIPEITSSVLNFMSVLDQEEIGTAKKLVISLKKEFRGGETKGDCSSVVLDDNDTGDMVNIIETKITSILSTMDIQNEETKTPENKLSPILNSVKRSFQRLFQRSIVVMSKDLVISLEFKNKKIEYVWNYSVYSDGGISQSVSTLAHSK